MSRTVERVELSLARRAAGVGIITQGFRDYFEGNGVASERSTPFDCGGAAVTRQRSAR